MIKIVVILLSMLLSANAVALSLQVCPNSFPNILPVGTRQIEYTGRGTDIYIREFIEVPGEAIYLLVHTLKIFKFTIALEFVWAGEINFNSGSVNTILQSMNYKPSILCVINLTGLYVINSNTGSLIASSGVSSSYRMTGLTYEYDWSDDFVYVLLKDVANVEGLTIEKYNINTMTSVTQRRFGVADVAVAQIGKIGTDTTKSFVMVTNTRLYSMNPLTLNLQFHYLLPGSTAFYDISMHLGSKSYIALVHTLGTGIIYLVNLGSGGQFSGVFTFPGHNIGHIHLDILAIVIAYIQGVGYYIKLNDLNPIISSYDFVGLTSPTDNKNLWSLTADGTLSSSTSSDEKTLYLTTHRYTRAESAWACNKTSSYSNIATSVTPTYNNVIGGQSLSNTAPGTNYINTTATDPFMSITSSVTNGAAFVVTSTAECDSVLVTTQPSQVITSYGDISVGVASLFCTDSATSSLFDVTMAINVTNSPTWIYVDSGASSVVGSTLSHGDSFSIDLNINVFGNQYSRNFILKILHCPRSNCLTCTDVSTCTKCEDEYVLTNSECEKSAELKEKEKMIETANTMGVTAAVVTSAAILAAIGIASMSTSSPNQMVFAMFGYYQLLSTILVLRYQIPKCLQELILNFGVFKLDFEIFSHWIPGANSVLDTWFNEAINQKNGKLSSIGYESGSMIDNYLFFFIGLLLMMLAHVAHNFLYPLMCCSDLDLTRKYVTNPKDLSWRSKIRVNLYLFFHLSVYVDGVLESLIFLYLNCLNEIVAFDLSSGMIIASLIFTFISFIVLNIISGYLCYRVAFKDIDNEDFGYFHSLYSGLKYSNRVYRAYYMSFIVRRILMCFGLILINLPVAQCCVYVFIQCLSLVYVIMHKSMEKTVDNLNLAICDAVIVIISATVFSMPVDGYSDFSEIDNERKGMILCYIIIGSNGLILLTTLANAIITKIKKRSKKYKVNVKKQIESSVSQISLNHERSNMDKLSQIEKSSQIEETKIIEPTPEVSSDGYWNENHQIQNLPRTKVEENIIQKLPKKSNRRVKLDNRFLDIVNDDEDFYTQYKDMEEVKIHKLRKRE